MGPIQTAAAFLKLIFDIVYARSSSLGGQYDIVRIGNSYFLARTDAKTCNYNLRSARKINLTLDRLTCEDERRFCKKFNIERPLPSWVRHGGMR
jgi:hypothetical protein